MEGLTSLGEYSIPDSFLRSLCVVSSLRMDQFPLVSLHSRCDLGASDRQGCRKYHRAGVDKTCLFVCFVWASRSLNRNNWYRSFLTAG